MVCTQNESAGMRWTRMLLQAKALTTAAEWAQAYAELAKEKDAQLAALTKEKDALAKEKDELAKQLSQCNAIANSSGLFGTLVALVCELRDPLSPHRHNLSALAVARAMCAAAAAVDAAAAMPPRQAAAAGAEPHLDTAPF
jgi:hypothetical protein